MKNKTHVIPVLLLGLIAVLATVPALTAQEEQQAQQEQQVVIPEQVKTVLQQGAQTRQPRLDIPFTFLDKDLYLPAQMNLHRVIFFKVKNVQLRSVGGLYGRSAGINRVFKTVKIPRSRKAFVIHSFCSLIKLIAISACIILIRKERRFLPAP